jgi:hypothetical protein
VLRAEVVVSGVLGSCGAGRWTVVAVYLVGTGCGVQVGGHDGVSGEWKVCDTIGGTRGDGVGDGRGRCRIVGVWCGGL